MNRESTFHAYTVGNAANRERFAGTAAAAGNDEAFKRLESLAAPLNNFDLYPDRVARPEFGDICP